MSSSVQSSAARPCLLPTKIAEHCSAGQMRTSLPTWFEAASASNSVSQVSLQRSLPAGHFDAALLQAFWREHGIFRAFCGAQELVAGGLAHDCVEACTGNNFASKVEPRALTTVGYMYHASCLLTEKWNQGPGQIYRVGWRATLVANHVQLRAARCQFQNCVRETFSARPEDPRSPRHAALRKNLNKLHLGVGFRLTVNAAG